METVAAPIASPDPVALVTGVPEGAHRTLPLLLSPSPGASPSVERLVEILAAHPGWREEALLRHGALLLRGFSVSGPDDFEEVARAFRQDLKNDYLGTSPRDALTEFVFSASELPGHYPIPQHCEMSFIKNPPDALFFSCLHAPEGPGGETPLVDFQAVWEALDVAVREEFLARGVTNIRNYCGPSGGSSFDLWKLKRWDEMFRTTDREKVKEVSVRNGFHPEFFGKDGLRLTNTQNAMKPHPQTGKPVWFNHTAVFHLSAVPGEYRRIASRMPEFRYQALTQVSRFLVWAKGRTPPETQAMHCTYGDGSPIADQDMEHVRDVIWAHMAFPRWHKGDVTVIDNHRVAHGRMPYRGPRKVAVCWA